MLDPDLHTNLYDAPMPPEAFAPDEAPDLGLLDAPSGSTDPRVQRWEINSDEEAQWAMAHAAETETALARLETQFASWRENLDALVERRRAPLDRRRRFFEERLIDYARRLRDADPKAKTLELPSGTVSSRGSKAMVIVEDAEAFLRWADLAERTDLFRIEKAPEVSVIRQSINVVNQGDEDKPSWRVVDPNTGEDVPGLGVQAPEVKFTVRPS